MNHTEALERAIRFAAERRIRYVVFAHRLNGRWHWYAKPVTHMAVRAHRVEQACVEILRNAQPREGS